MAGSTAAEVFEHYSQGIMYSLPMNNVSFMVELQKHDLLPVHIYDELKLLNKSTEKASYFLDNVIKAELLKDNVHTSLNELLTVMMESGYDNMKELATKVKSKIPVDNNKYSAGMFSTHSSLMISHMCRIFLVVWVKLQSFTGTAKPIYSECIYVTG